MTILFCGGELEDFTTTGSPVISTGGSLYRTTYARLAIQVTNAQTLTAAFTASSLFSVTWREYFSASSVANSVFFLLNSGGSNRLRLKIDGSYPTTITLQTYNGSSATTLATSTATIAATTVYRFDVVVDYQTAGRVRVYLDQSLIIDYSGNVTAAGSTTLDSLAFSGVHSSSPSSVSEIIVCTQDSRTLSLKTLAPDAAGTANAWTGAYTDIDEVTASETDVMTSATANQVANLNTTGMPSGWSNLTVTAVKITASAARGATGPTKLALGVRTNSTDSFPTAVTLDTGFSAAATTLYELNPVTGVAWTTAEIDALQIALKSET